MPSFSQNKAILSWAVLAVALFICSPLSGGLPGYQKRQITDTKNDVENYPAINDLGNIAWHSSLKNDRRHNEIYVYSNGSIARLTTDVVTDAWPRLNNQGEIIWSRGSGPIEKGGPTSEIVHWKDNEIWTITNNKWDDTTSSINDNGVFTWYQVTGWTCRGAAIFGVRKFEEGTIIEVYDDGASHQTIDILDNGRLVWARYDFCEDPWQSKILLRETDGTIVTISDGFEPQLPRFAPTGEIAWTDSNAVYVWDNGNVTEITSDGRNPSINSRGDIAFIRWNNTSKAWETWLYLGGEFRQIAASANWEIAYDMNEWGDIVVLSCNSAVDKSEVFLYHRLPDGDMNCDERVDFDDIDGFVSAITNRDQYESDHPDCDWWLADMSGNRSVDFDDIDGFINCLTEGGCER